MPLSVSGVASPPNNPNSLIWIAEFAAKKKVWIVATSFRDEVVVTPPRDDSVPSVVSEIVGGVLSVPMAT